MPPVACPQPIRRGLRWLALVGAALIALAMALLWLWPRPQPQPQVREMTRDALILREGRLFPNGEAQPFAGRLIENYPNGARKLAIDVLDGRLHGRSVGWYANGQMEVDEHFVEGVSHGERTRWYANGNRRSLAQIERGKVVGPFVEWHENGQKAVEMTVREDGKPEGIVEAWHPSGAPKSRLRYADGKQIEKEFWKDRAPALAAATDQK